MENQINNSGLKSLVIVLSVLFALSLVYIYKLTTDVNSTETKLATTLSEKDQVMHVSPNLFLLHILFL